MNNRVDPNLQTPPQYTSPQSMTFYNKPFIGEGALRLVFVSKKGSEVDAYCDGVLLASNLKHGSIVNYSKILEGTHVLTLFNSVNKREVPILEQPFLIYPDLWMTLCLIEREDLYEIFAITDNLYPEEPSVQKLRFVNLSSTSDPLMIEINQVPFIFETERMKVSEYITLNDSVISLQLRESEVASIGNVKSNIRLQRGKYYSAFIFDKTLDFKKTISLCEDGLDKKGN
ncbi:MAG: DUF4397 domain-containing protein [Turicibacter sp.]